MNPTEWLIRNVRRHIPNVLVVPHPREHSGWIVVLVLWEGSYLTDQSDALNASSPIADELRGVVDIAHESWHMDTPRCAHCGAPDSTRENQAGIRENPS